MAAGLNPLTLRRWDKCTTTVILQLILMYTLDNLLSPGDSHGIWTQTIDLWMMRQVFYIVFLLLIMNYTF